MRINVAGRRWEVDLYTVGARHALSLRYANNKTIGQMRFQNPRCVTVNTIQNYIARNPANWKDDKFNKQD